MKSIAFFQFSTEEDLSFVLEFSGLDLTGRDFEIKVTERASNTTKVTLTNGSGITVTGTNVLEAAYAKAAMTGWARGEYSADIVDVTDGAHSRIMAVRFVLDLPGRLVQGVQNRKVFINWSPNQAVVTATGAIGPAGPTGLTGPQGDNGWTPELAVVTDGARRVQQVVDWFGGEGVKPAAGKYVGAAGLVDLIADAIDLRGAEGPDMLIDALATGGDDLGYDDNAAVAKAGDDNERQPLKRLLGVGGLLQFDSVAAASALVIPASVKAVQINGAADEQGGPGHIRRRAGAEPTSGRKHRSVDRFTADGGSDSVNGGWWVAISGKATPDIDDEDDDTFVTPHRARDGVHANAKDGVLTGMLPFPGFIARTVLEKLGDLICLQDFGAVGDGVTDETANVQAAMDYAASIGGGTIYAGSGRRTFIVANLIPRTGVTLYGAGTDNGGVSGGQFAPSPVSTFKLKAASNGSIFKFPIRTFQRTSAGTVAATNGSTAIVGSGTDFTQFPAAAGAFYIAGVGYTVASVTDATHLTLTQNYAGTTGSGKAYSADTETVTVQPVNSFVLHNFTLDGNGPNNSSGMGLAFDSADPASINNQNQDDAISIRSCVIRGFKTAGVAILPGHRGIRCLDNQVIDNDGDGVRVTASDIDFSGMFVGNNGGHNYWLSGCAAVSIRGGEVWASGRATDATKHGVKIEDSAFFTSLPGAGPLACSNILVAPVQIDRCGGAGVDVSGASEGVRISSGFFENSTGTASAHGHINAGSSVNQGVMFDACAFLAPGGVSHAIKATSGNVIEGNNQGVVSTNDPTKLIRTGRGLLRVDGAPVLNSDGSNTFLLAPDGALAVIVGSESLYRRATHKFQDAAGSPGRVELGAYWDTWHLVMGAYHLWVDGAGKLRIKNGAPSSDGDGAVVGTQT